MWTSKTVLKVLAIVFVFCFSIGYAESDAEKTLDLTKDILRRFKRGSSKGSVCGGNVTVSSLGGSLTSPRYPNSYPSDVRCQWRLSTSQSRNIVLQLSTFDTEDYTNCEFDYLDISTGEVRLQRLCGSVRNYTVQTNASQVQLLFVSDSTYEEKGFVLNYLLEPEQGQSADGCLSALNQNEGSLTSPGWPESYLNSQDCWTLIKVDPGKNIYLSFQDLALEASDNCEYDFVEIFDGPSEDSQRLGRYCSQSDSPLLKSSSNTLMVHFHSDSLLNDKGYRANFTTTGFLNNQGHIGECKWERGVRNGNISSPDYPGKYPSNALCRVQLEAPEGHHIKVAFQNLSLEKDDICGFDWVELRDGDQVESSPIAKICGSNSSIPTFRSNSNKMAVSFHSDGFFELQGFLLRYSFHENIRKALRPSQSTNNNNLGLGNRHERDAFATFPPNATVEKGQAHVLDCIPRNPLARIRWFKDQDFIGGKNIPKGLTLISNNTLRIDSMTSSHVGIYKCVAVLPDITATATAWIGMLFNSTECPIVLRNIPYDVSLSEGEFKLLECGGTATELNETVQMTWEKNGSPLSLSQRVQRLNSGYLAINGALPGDEGIYTCVATATTRRCEKRASAKLEVIKKQNIEEICGRPMMESDEDDGEVELNQGKIIGGTTAERGAHPWQAMIWDPQNKAFCGGALLNERWMMTAAHCFHATKIQWDRVEVRLGKVDQAETESGEFSSPIESIIEHPNFEGKSSYDNDVALVRLKNRVKFSNYILPICLGETRFVENTFFKEPRVGIVAGWGKLAERGSTPRHLKELKLPTVRWPVCKMTTTSATVTRNMFCAGYAQEVVADSCSGDSGGPFVVEDKGVKYAIGIVSWGEGCARPGQYGFYTKINNYHAWIKGIIQT